MTYIKKNGKAQENGKICNNSEVYHDQIYIEKPTEQVTVTFDTSKETNEICEEISAAIKNSQLNKVNEIIKSVPLQQVVKFKDLKVGDTFYRHHENDRPSIKVSSRRAKYNSGQLYKIGKGNNVWIDPKTSISVPVLTRRFSMGRILLLGGALLIGANFHTLVDLAKPVQSVFAEKIIYEGVIESYEPYKLAFEDGTVIDNISLRGPIILGKDSKLCAGWLSYYIETK